jgi:hypothetical protein
VCEFFKFFKYLWVLCTSYNWFTTGYHWFDTGYRWLYSGMYNWNSSGIPLETPLGWDEGKTPPFGKFSRFRPFDCVDTFIPCIFLLNLGTQYFESEFGDNFP